MRDVVERLTSEANTSPDDSAVFWGYEARKRKRSKRISRSVQVFTVYQNLFSLHLFIFYFSKRLYTIRIAPILDFYNVHWSFCCDSAVPRRQRTVRSVDTQRLTHF